jgi:hypothetical protein
MTVERYYFIYLVLSITVKDEMGAEPAEKDAAAPPGLAPLSVTRPRPAVPARRGRTFVADDAVVRSRAGNVGIGS